MALKKMIGIVGGVGSYAGIDLIKKIYDQTDALCDQDHLPVSMLSVPDKIWDRTDFLLGNSNHNPGIAISDVINVLYHNGASIIGIPCNTAHSPLIFDEIIRNTPVEIQIIHMIEAVVQYIHNHYSGVKKVGVLSTTGTLMTNIYPHYFSQYNIDVIQMPQELQDLYVHAAIYDLNYGIKAVSNPVSNIAKNDLMIAVNYLIKKNVELIILGCTEIPLAITEMSVDDIPIIDATKILAYSLVAASSPAQVTLS